jgi:phosphopantetheinyl transferase
VKPISFFYPSTKESVRIDLSLRMIAPASLRPVPFLRLTLANFLGEDPAALMFAYGPRRRPRLDGCGARPQFSLSHSEDLALLAISWASPLGVDVESVELLTDRDSMAAQIMHPIELALFERIPEHQRTTAFFRLWTRKEAALKAIGTGFLTEPRSLFVGFDHAGEEAEIMLNGRACAVRDVTVSAGHIAAVCGPQAAALELHHLHTRDLPEATA